MKLTKEYKVKATMLGSMDCMSPIGAFEVIEDAITELMGKLKIDGITVKEKYNAFWVFVKNKVKFFEKILWNEEFVVSSFISYKSLAKMNLDVEAKTKSNKLIFYAHVEACALDRTTNSIRKLSTVGVTDEMQPEQPLMEMDFSKFESGDLTKVEQIKVRSTNIDMSHHTNNLEYLRFIFNTYSVSELELRPIKCMEVVYANQSFENDCLDVLKCRGENKDTIILQKENAPIIKCEVLF